MASPTRPIRRDRPVSAPSATRETKIPRPPSMSRQDANAAFALSSFLQGTNATYIDDIYARYEKDPASVDSEWQEFFKSLKDAPDDVRKNAEGPSWARDNWPQTLRDDLTSARDGKWALGELAISHQLTANP